MIKSLGTPVLKISKKIFEVPHHPEHPYLVKGGRESGLG